MKRDALNVDETLSHLGERVAALVAAMKSGIYPITHFRTFNGERIVYFVELSDGVRLWPGDGSSAGKFKPWAVYLLTAASDYEATGERKFDRECSQCGASPLRVVDFLDQKRHLSGPCSAYQCDAGCAECGTFAGLLHVRTDPFPVIPQSDCPECHGDGWTRGWGPGPCRTCAMVEDRKRVPY